MVTTKRPTPLRIRIGKVAPVTRPQVTTIRLDDAVQKGLRMLEAHSGVKRPLNKWVNIALADFIDRHAATLERELDQALKNIRAYRKTDPGYKRAIKAFIEAEVAHAAQDPMEGSPEPRAAGPAVSMVREMLRG
jgi:predicted transcriptional regulator